MRPLYQNQWHQISFSSLGQSLSLSSLPSSTFYESFYLKFHQTYSSSQSLSKDWLSYKISIANLLANHIDSSSSVLSVGSGLGIVEEHLVYSGISNVDLQEVTIAPLKWASYNNIVRNIVATDNISDSFFPSSYDAIILNGIDYALHDSDFIELLTSAFAILRPHGTLFLISVSYDKDNLSPLRYLKNTILDLYNKYLISGTQLWGYIRTVQELYYLIQESCPSSDISFINFADYSQWPTLILKIQKPTT